MVIFGKRGAGWVVEGFEEDEGGFEVKRRACGRDGGM